MSGHESSMDTKLIHAGEIRPRVHGAVSLPIFQSANYEYAGETDYHDLKYIRLSNTPNHRALAGKLAALEGAEAALVAASGMAAITTTLLAVVSAGDHVLFQDCLYGGTLDFVAKDLAGFGIAHDFVEGARPETWADKVRPETKAIYVETITNPLIQVADLEAVVAFARKHGLVSMIDNTFASPVNFRPSEIGFDLSLHSGTKYLNGHSDIVAGAVTGRADLIDRVLHKLNHLGGVLDPHACFLLNRGLMTLALRVRRHNENAMALARAFESHSKVATVHYPGLEGDPGHAAASRLFDGYGGMLSLELDDGGPEEARRFLEALSIPIVAPSLGGVHSLITIPATTSHLGMSREDRLKIGVTDGLIRVSTGIEGTDDLVADFAAALDAV